MKALENDKMVTYRTTNRYILITIINYEKYQGGDEQNEEQNEEQIRNRLGTDYKRGYSWGCYTHGRLLLSLKKGSYL